MKDYKMLQATDSTFGLGWQTDDKLQCAIAMLSALEVERSNTGISSIIDAVGNAASAGCGDLVSRCRRRSAAATDGRFAKLRSDSMISVLGFLYEELDDLRSNLAEEKSVSVDRTLSTERLVDQISDAMTDIIGVLTATACSSQDEVTIKARLMKYFIVDAEADLINLLAKSLCDDVLNFDAKA
jgi:hypothetical protein